MNPLPFYEVLAELIKPTSLVIHGQYSAHKTIHHFALSPLQKDKIDKSRQIIRSTTEDGVPTTTIEYSTQVQLRFWAQESSRQDGLLPAELTLLVNNETVHSPPPPIPRMPRKRPTAQAFDITKNVMHFVSNFISIKWFAEPEHNFFVSVNLVRKLTAQEMFLKLMTNPVKPSYSTQKLIKDLTSKEDQDLCCPASLRVSLICPLGKSRMSYPCRGVNCKHLQCFDANLFLKMNEKKSCLVCPVCSLKLQLSELCIDGCFMDVIKSLSNKQSENDVELFPDGSWRLVYGGTPNQTSKNKSPSDMFIETVTLDGEDDEIFIINHVNDTSFRLFTSGVQRASSRRNSLFEECNSTIESSFRLFACGVERSSSRRNSLCEEATQVIPNEPEIIDILD